MTEPTDTPGPSPTGSGVEVWADYAKDRFDFWADRVNELRNRARQLGAAVGVVIGLELTLLARFALEAIPTRGRWLFLSCLAALFVAFGLQLQKVPKDEIRRTSAASSTITGSTARMIVCER